jgi:hypothetical protein
VGSDRAAAVETAGTSPRHSFDSMDVSPRVRRTSAAGRGGSGRGSGRGSGSSGVSGISGGAAAAAAGREVESGRERGFERGHKRQRTDDSANLDVLVAAATYSLT